VLQVLVYTANIAVAINN